MGLFSNQARGFVDVDIYTATQADFSDAVFNGNFTFTLTGNADEDSPFEVRALGGNVGRYVRLDVISYATTILGGKQITFGVGDTGGYRLTISGECPGRVTVQWSGGTPNSQHAIIFGNNLGSFTIPNNQPCNGTVLGVSGNVRLVDPPGIFSNQGGSGSISGQAGSAACGHYLQLVEGGTCQTSNVAQIP